MRLCRWWPFPPCRFGSSLLVFFGPGGEYVGLGQAREMHGQRHRQGVQVVGRLAQLVHSQGEGLRLVAGFGVAA